MMNELSLFSSDILNFVVIYERRSINSAARQLNHDPGNLSRQLAQLEKLLGLKLFERHKTGLAPLPSADSMYSAIKAARREFDLKARDSESGKVIRVGFSPTTGFSHFQRFLKGLVGMKSKVEFHLANSLALIEHIKKRELDFVLVARSIKLPGTISRTFFAENLVLCSAGGRPGKALLINSEMLSLEKVIHSIQYSEKWVINDYFVIAGFLAAQKNLMGLLPESLLKKFPELKIIKSFRGEGKITALTWPKSEGAQLLKYSQFR